MRYGAKFLHLITRQKRYLAASELKAMNAQVCYSFTQYYFFSTIWPFNWLLDTGHGYGALNLSFILKILQI